MIDRLLLKCGNLEHPIGELSSGNQQEAVFGRAIVLKPPDYVIECPNVGADVKAAAELHRLILDLADADAGILLATDDLDEALKLSDRILVQLVALSRLKLRPAQRRARRWSRQ